MCSLALQCGSRPGLALFPNFHLILGFWLFFTEIDDQAPKIGVQVILVNKYVHPLERLLRCDPWLYNVEVVQD